MYINCYTRYGNIFIKILVNISIIPFRNTVSLLKINSSKNVGYFLKYEQRNGTTVLHTNHKDRLKIYLNTGTIQIFILIITTYVN